MSVLASKEALDPNAVFYHTGSNEVEHVEMQGLMFVSNSKSSPFLFIKSKSGIACNKRAPVRMSRFIPDLDLKKNWAILGRCWGLACNKQTDVHD